MPNINASQNKSKTKKRFLGGNEKKTHFEKKHSKKYSSYRCMKKKHLESFEHFSAVER